MSCINIRLQGSDQLINELYQHTVAFDKKLRLRESQLEKKNYAHFPRLNKPQLEDPSIFVTFIQDLQQQFVNRFADMHGMKDDY